MSSRTNTGSPTPPSPGGPLSLARMTGTSIAGHDAAPWVTDFLNAACYRRPVEQRQVEELRLAWCILTTAWYRKSRRLHLTDLPAFHRAFGPARLRSSTSARGALDRADLLAGAVELFGSWFPAAWADPARRGWGIAFETVEERDAYDPEARLRLAPVGELTPATAPPEERTWHTYPPVEVPAAEGVVALLTRPERWPDFASELGRFTPLRAGGLLGQTFEVDVAAGTGMGLPLFTRGYVTVTALVTQEDPAALDAWFAALEDGLARHGKDEPRAVPEGATPLVGFELTTHEGHFMGAGHNRLLLYAGEDGRVFVRAAGTWDPMPWHLAQAYERAGEAAQHAFWGQGDEARLSLLHQLAEAVRARPAVV